MKTEVTEIPEVFSNQKVIVKKRVILNKDNYSGII